MPKNVSVEELKAKAKELRLKIIETAKYAGSGHVGGSLSCADILAALYFKYLNVDPENPDMPERDKFILSKGHVALAYVPCLALRGFVPMKSLETFNYYESAYGMHPDSNKIRGCDASTGSLGHGLSMGVGMALGHRYQNIDAKVVVLMGDGEQNEGSIWEAAMASSHFKLHNVIAIVDRNKFCIDGCTEDIMAIEPLDKKYEAFGFKVIKCNGNDMAEVVKALDEAWVEKEKPVCIIAETEKGFGVKKFQGDVKWHYGAMDMDLFLEAKADIEAM
ncbi:MAG TPA: transketolase [Clostridiales bacterium]|nr:transketolase [Clostridiales bacterium]